MIALLVQMFNEPTVITKDSNERAVARIASFSILIYIMEPWAPRVFGSVRITSSSGFKNCCGRRSLEDRTRSRRTTRRFLSQEGIRESPLPGG